jgi:hypothetical protein
MKLYSRDEHGELWIETDGIIAVMVFVLVLVAAILTAWVIL